MNGCRQNPLFMFGYTPPTPTHSHPTQILQILDVTCFFMLHGIISIYPSHPTHVLYTPHPLLNLFPTHPYPIHIHTPTPQNILEGNGVVFENFTINNLCL